MPEVLICLIIALGKILEIITYTVRTVLITRNLKIPVSILGVINNLIGITLIVLVVDGISENIYRAFAFAIGETIGTYIGMWLEKKLALGNNMVTVVVNKSIAQKVIDNLLGRGYQTTYMTGKGLKAERTILKVFSERKRKNGIIEAINEEHASAVIFDSKVLNVKGN